MRDPSRKFICRERAGGWKGLDFGLRKVTEEIVESPFHMEIRGDENEFPRDLISQDFPRLAGVVLGIAASCNFEELRGGDASAYELLSDPGPVGLIRLIEVISKAAGQENLQGRIPLMHLKRLSATVQGHD